MQSFPTALARGPWCASPLRTKPRQLPRQRALLETGTILLDNDMIEFNVNPCDPLNFGEFDCGKLQGITTALGLGVVRLA